HQLCGNTKEVSPVLPTDIFPVYKSKICFVDQGCSLKGVVGALEAQAVGCQSAEFLIDHRHQFFQSRLVAVAPIDEQLGHLSRRCHTASSALITALYQFRLLVID